MRISDWSSDVCSSDLPAARLCCAAGLCIQEDVVCSLPVETRRPGRIIELGFLGLRANTWGVVIRINAIIEPTDGRRSRQPISANIMQNRVPAIPGVPDATRCADRVERESVEWGKSV